MIFFTLGICISNYLTYGTHLEGEALAEPGVIDNRPIINKKQPYRYSVRQMMNIGSAGASPSKR